MNSIPNPSIMTKFAPKKPARTDDFVYRSETGGRSGSPEAVKFEVEQDLLVFWWKCYRKIRFETEDEARYTNAAFDADANSFKCSYCGWWHNGRGTTDERKYTGSHELRRQWVRRVNKPSVAELREGFESPSKTGKFYDPEFRD